MLNSKPVEEICYDLNSNLFEKTNNICAMTKRGNWKKGTWGKIFLKKKDIKVKKGEIIKGEYLQAKKHTKRVAYNIK